MKSLYFYIVAIILIVSSVIAVGPKELAFYYTDFTSPTRTVLSVQCDPYTLSAYEDEQVVTGGNWVVGRILRLESTYTFSLTRLNEDLTLVRDIGIEPQSMYYPIQEGYTFKDPAETVQEFEISSSYKHHTQEWFLDSSEIDSDAFKKLSECLFAHKEDIESVPFHVGDGNHPILPIRGVYRLDDAKKFAHGYSYTSEFVCDSGEVISVKSFQFIWGVEFPLAISLDGTIGAAWDANEEQKQAAVMFDASSCRDNQGTSMTEFYKTRATTIKQL